MQILDRPLLEFFRDLNTRKVLFNLPFQFSHLHAPLLTARPFALAAMVVGVVEEGGIGHGLNRGLTPGTTIPVAAGKLKAT